MGSKIRQPPGFLQDIKFNHTRIGIGRHRSQAASIDCNAVAKGQSLKRDPRMEPQPPAFVPGGEFQYATCLFNNACKHNSRVAQPHADVPAYLLLNKAGLPTMLCKPSPTKRQFCRMAISI